MPSYDFKFWQELGWAVGIAVFVFVLTSAAGYESVEDPKAWLISIAIGAARAAAGAALAKLRPAP